MNVKKFGEGRWLCYNSSLFLLFLEIEVLMNRLSLIFYALLALAISVMLTGQAKPVYSFFQSPAAQSAQSDESPVATPTEVPETPPEPTATPLPTEEAPPEPTATPLPTQPPATLELPTTQPLTPTIPGEVQPTMPPPTPLPSSAPAAVNVVNEVKFIDTVVQWFAWLWLCLGVSVILVVLPIFPFLQIRGSHLKRKNEE